MHGSSVMQIMVRLTGSGDEMQPSPYNPRAPQSGFAKGTEEEEPSVWCRESAGAQKRRVGEGA